jgi:amino acid transporter
MGAVSTALLVGNALLSSRADNVFWMIFRLSGVCFLVSYLLLFPAFLFLRHRQPGRARPYRMPGGRGVAWAATVLCWTFVAFACVLFFKPTPGAGAAGSGWRESLLLLAEALATLGLGLWFVPWARPAGAPAPSAPATLPT